MSNNKEYDTEKYDQDMGQYYSKDSIKKFGACGIVLELLCKSDI